MLYSPYMVMSVLFFIDAKQIIEITTIAREFLLPRQNHI